MNVREARFLFSALKEKVFLDSGAVGLMPEPAVQAVKELVDFASRMQGPDTRSVYRNPKRDWELVRKLINGDIVLSMRYTSRVGGIRASVHYFNNEGDIDKLIEAISELK